jgi:hypothetical protein
VATTAGWSQRPTSHISRAAQASPYPRIIDTAIRLGLNRSSPCITSRILGGSDDGSWMGPQAAKRFATYVKAVAGILDGVEWIC